MERLVLTARVVHGVSGYVATVEQLPLEGLGESVREAQDQLVQVTRAWIETHDGQDTLGKALAQAGFPGVEEDTELQLEFIQGPVSDEKASG